MADTLQHLAPHARNPTGRNWLSLLLGHADRTRPGVIRLLVTLGAHVFISLILWTAVGAARVPAEPAWVLTAYIYAGMGLFYGLLRSGWAATRAEPTLTFPQVLHNIGAILLAYALIEKSRLLAMQFLCLTVVFDMHRLSQRQVIAGTSAAIVGLIGIVAYDLLCFPDRYHVAGELINVGMMSLTMPMLVFVSAFARRLRRQLHQQKADMAQALAQMEALSIRDTLTGAHTRRHLQSLMEAECRRRQRTQRPFSVVMLDIDHFKRINDAFGHAVGDAVLVDFARCVRLALDEHHALGRWGGEEFMVLMPETELAQAMETMKRVRQALRANDWSRHAPGLAVTFSAGARQHAPRERMEDTVAAADQALYAAKAQGRDRVIPAASPPARGHAP